FNTGAAERADESRRLDAEAERQHQERLLQVPNGPARAPAEPDHKRQSRAAGNADRRAPHTRLLTRLEGIQAAAGTLLAGVSVVYSLGEDPEERDIDLPNLPQEFVADVALVGSDNSAAKVQSAGTAVSLLGIAVAMIELTRQNRTEDQR